MNERDLGLLVGMIGRLSSDLNMVKAFSHVTLREISKLQETSEYQSLIKDVESLHAQYVLDTDKVFKELLNYSINPEQRDSSLDKLFDR